MAILEGTLRRYGQHAMHVAFAAVSRAARTADVRADEAASCHVLPLETFDWLGETRPDIKLALLENLLTNVCQTVTRLTHEVAVLAQWPDASLCDLRARVGPTPLERANRQRGWRA